MKAPRYSTEAFPAYRYLPTHNPHPGIHPDGHSYGKAEEKIPYQAPEDWQQNHNYLYGIDLFNHGYFWEAHEAWEGIWLSTKKFDAYGQFLQSLIQFSASLVKLYGGNQRGFNKLYQEALKRMKFVLKEIKQSHWMGLEIKAWLKNFKDFQETSPDPQGQVQDPLERKDFPFLKLDND